MATRDPGCRRLLRTHFLWRFVENDVLSPDADRRETLSFVAATLIVPSCFLAALLSLKYLFGQETPGIVALVSLDDKLTFIMLSMIGTGLLTVLCWDAVSLDDRDRAILGPLPLDGRTLVRAKLEAVGLFAAIVLVVINAASVVLFPLLHVARLPIGFGAVVALYQAHAAATLLAGVFTCVAVIGTREVVRGITGDARFRRVGLVVQAGFVVAFVGALLLLPLSTSDVGATLVRRPEARVLPPVWFLGLYERLGGSAELRVVGATVPRFLVRANDRDAATYVRVAPILRDVAPLAPLAVAIAVVVGTTAYVGNARRLSSGATFTRRRARGALRRRAAALAGALLRAPTTRAGFFLTATTLTRSPPHRLAMAVALASVLAATTGLLAGTPFGAAHDAAAIPLRLLAVQLVAVVVTVVGVAHARRLPAHLAAGWAFRLSWRGHRRAFETGVRRAVIVGLLVPVVLALLPLHVATLGIRLAVMHAIFGLLAGVLVLDASRFGSATISLMSPYEPSGRLKTLAPIYGLAFVMSVALTVRVERWALGDPVATIALMVGLLLVLVTLRLASIVVSGRRARERDLLDYDVI